MLTMFETWMLDPGREPKLAASPYPKIPPSDPTIQYPWPSAVGAMPTMFETWMLDPGTEP